MKNRANISTNLGDTLSPVAVWSKKAYASFLAPGVGADFGFAAAAVPALFYIASLAFCFASILN